MFRTEHICIGLAHRLRRVGQSEIIGHCSAYAHETAVAILEKHIVRNKFKEGLQEHSLCPISPNCQPCEDNLRDNHESDDTKRCDRERGGAHGAKSVPMSQIGGQESYCEHDPQKEGKEGDCQAMNRRDAPLPIHSRHILSPISLITWVRYVSFSGW